MSDELRAAAEKVRDLSGDVDDTLSGSHGPGDPFTYRGSLLHDLLEAAIVLRKGVLDLLPPTDDAEPVTEEWLQSTGFIRACFEDRCFGYHHKNRCYTLNLRTRRGCVSNIDVFTRGDVRRLLAAFNLTTNPGA